MGNRHTIIAGHCIAAHAGFQILESGGNAIDAGIADPRRPACGLGWQEPVMLPPTNAPGGIRNSAPSALRTSPGRRRRLVSREGSGTPGDPKVAPALEHGVAECGWTE